MSGPVASADVPPAPGRDAPERCDVEVLDGRDAQVGGFPVRRVLPRRQRRTVGAWCFVDHMGPGGSGLNVGPHPHIGLQTVTWLFQGALLHRDSLGSEQLVRPGQLNLMTAGRGVAHAEETAGVYDGPLHGVQLWVAQPSATRDGEPAFEHHADLPHLDAGAGAAAVVLVGDFLGASSPARRDTDHLGVDLTLVRGETAVPLDARFEHALVVVDGSVTAAGRSLTPGRLAYLGTGRDELRLTAAEPARLLLLGGAPFPEPVLMWWNYVARTRDEITTAHRDWTVGTARFGPVASPLPRIDTGAPPWAATR